MTRYRFLLSRRWLGWFALAVVFAGVCVLLGHWQYDRYRHRLATAQLIAANYDAHPARLDGVLPDAARLAANREWRPVELTGSYDPANTLLVRNRPTSDGPGFEMLVPFHDETTGRWFLVDRGWLPTGARGGSAHVSAAPSGRVVVVARLRPGEPAVSRGAPRGQVASIDLPQIARLTGVPIATGAYGQLARETPAQPDSPQLAERPSIDTGTNLSYAFQWFTFGIMGFVGLGYAARREAHSGEPRKPSAEETEDAELDAQGL